MKCIKYFLPLIFIAALSIPITADAISGACSWHGGVNCSMGRQLNGNVYCNDGWTESVAEYDFMVACKDYDFQCTTEEWNILSQKYKIEDLFSQMQDITNKMSDNALSKSFDEYLAYSLQTQYNALKSQYDTGINLADSECKALGADRAYSKEYERMKLEFYNDQIKAEQDKLTQLEQQKQEINKNYLDALNKLNDYTPTCPANSTLVGNNCNCNTGYFVYTSYPDQCMTPTNWCKLKYGDHIYENDTKCICESGYIWNGSKCIIQSQTGSVLNSETINIPEGAIIRADNDIDIYIVKYVGSKKFKRLILSPSVFNNYGHLRWEDVMDVSQATIDSFTTSELVRAVGDDKIYRLYPQGDSGQKRLIKNSSVLAKLGLDSDSIYEINSFDRESYITGANLE